MTNKKIVISISMGKKDNDLKRWKQKLNELELEQSFYIREALYASLKGKKIFLGRIFPAAAENIYLRTTYSIPKNDIELMEYIKKLKDKNVNMSSFLKKLIRNFIEKANSQEDEYIPDYSDMYNYLNKNKIDHIEASNMESLNPKQPPSSKSEPLINKEKSKPKKINPMINKFVD